MEFVMMKSAHQVTPYFAKTALPRKKGEGVILCVKSNLLPQRVLLPPTTPSSPYVSLIVCEQLLNTEPLTIAIVYRSPSTPPPENISLICTLDTIISCQSDCIVLGDFNCLKVNRVSNTAQPNTVDSQLLNFCSDSLLHQRVLTPTRFRVNQHPYLLDLFFVQFPHLISPISFHPPLCKSDHTIQCVC